jgi:hypothetical protein
MAASANKPIVANSIGNGTSTPAIMSKTAMTARSEQQTGELESSCIAVAAYVAGWLG